MIEYWSSETYLFPELSTGIKFQMKIDTDLYELMKVKSLIRITIITHI